MFHINIHNNHFSNVPLWSTRQFILNGYRQQQTFFDCLVSLFHIHNETVNIWSHLIGIPIFSYFLSQIDNNLLLSLYVYSCLFVFSASSIFHLMTSHSLYLYELTLQFDMISIFIFIILSYILGIQNSFHCYQNIKTLYYTILFFSCLTFISLLQFFKNNFKMYMFILFGFTVTSIIPFIHTLFINDTHITQHLYFANNFLFIMIIYLFGFLCFISKFPECFFHGRFDFFGNSHQLWHISILIGLCYSYHTFHNYFIYWNNHSCIT